MHVPTRKLRRLVRGVQRKLTERQAKKTSGLQVHIGCGDTRLDGWVNVDKFKSAATDIVYDVRYGVPFRDSRYIFAEHFLEHLSYTEAVSFLQSCRASL